jgi:hypothetical protein
MRPSVRLLSLLSAAALGLGPRASAQATERTDAPAHGVLRVTFDPVIMAWDARFTDQGRIGLGAALTGDTVGSAHIPALARLEQDVRTVSGISGFVASLGAGLFAVHEERRSYPITAELGLTDRLSVRLMVPIVRVATRTHLTLSARTANVGANPLLSTQGASAAYATFFQQFKASLAQLDSNIVHGQYGCAGNPACAARDSLNSWQTVYNALYRSALGVGVPGGAGSPFMPLDSSAAGKAITAEVDSIEGHLVSQFAVGGFASAFLLAPDTLNPAEVEAVILDSATGFGYRRFPFEDRFRYGLGDLELGAKYRFATGHRYAGAVEALVRLPTGATDSADDWMGLSIGDHLTGLEAALSQELTLGPLWLNVALRGGHRIPGTRVQRVAPFDAVLVPFAATTALAWAPGDYVGLDVAPLLRLAPQIAAGFTAGYYTKRADRYTFSSVQDSTTLSTRLGVPTSASVLDLGTAEHWLRLGVAVSYLGPSLEGGFSIEQTVMGGGATPAGRVYRIVLKSSRKLF